MINWKNLFKAAGLTLGATFSLNLLILLMAWQWWVFLLLPLSFAVFTVYLELEGGELK